MTDLLPCPFCGSSNIHDLKNFDWVACEDCGAQIEDGEPSARELWNRRAPQPLGVAQGSGDCGEAATWIAFGVPGNVRFWTSDSARAEQEKQRGLDLRRFSLAELIALVAHTPRWQSIETYTPAHELNVLVVDEGVVSEAYYNGESDAWFKEGKSEHDFDFVDSDRLFPTHWMPMPAPPSALTSTEGK